MFRRRKRDRVPHPDPAVELQLQRIISMQRIIEGKHALLGEVNRKLRQHAGNGGRMSSNLRRDLTNEGARLEKEIMDLHEGIATAIGELDPSDASYLQGRG